RAARAPAACGRRRRSPRERRSRATEGAFRVRSSASSRSPLEDLEGGSAPLPNLPRKPAPAKPALGTERQSLTADLEGHLLLRQTPGQDPARAAAPLGRACSWQGWCKSSIGTIPTTRGPSKVIPARIRGAPCGVLADRARPACGRVLAPRLTPPWRARVAPQA